MLMLAPTAALADRIELPTSDAAQVQSTALLRQLPSFRPDRVLPSNVPGPVLNDEVVFVGLAGDGRVAKVSVDQRLQLKGTGDYAIRERGPARSATPLSEEPPPVTHRGAVVWQGFSPGGRSLGARLVLDPLIEAQHLPLSLRIAYRDTQGREQPLGPGGTAPGAGTVAVTVVNGTEQPAELPTGSDASASELARHLDRAWAIARKPSARRLPTTDAGLPKTLDVSDAARTGASQATPYRLTGSLRLVGAVATLSGPATSPLPDGGTVAGVLGGTGGTPEATFTLTTPSPGVLALDLTAVAVLDPRALAPPRGLASWRAWAAADPPRSERKEALDLLVEVAATGARATSYSPYLGADLLGTGSTTFRFALAPKEVVAVRPAGLEPRWGAISLAGSALLLVVVNLALIWRRL
jgi:hypothetical protein